MSVKSVTVKIFYAVCFIVAIYMTVEQFIKYQRNNDSSSMEFKTFQNSEENKYPDISLCFLFEEQNMFNETKLPYNTSSKDMAMIIQGEYNHLQNTTIENGSRILHQLSEDEHFNFDNL